MRTSTSTDEPGFRTYKKARHISKLIVSLTVLISLSQAFSQTQSDAPSKGIATATPTNPYVTISRLGDSDGDAILRDGQMLSLRRKTDPFGLLIRGQFKGAAPVVESTAPASKPAEGPVQVPAVAATIEEPSLERAIQELSIGAVNVAGHEILIGSRSIREGDLLVLESHGRQFCAWVQSVGVLGISFSDTDLKKQFFKPFGSAPTLPSGEFAGNLPNLGQFPDHDAHR